MGETMMCRYGALSALRWATAISALAICHSAFAADLPEVKVSASNKVPECATPGRLSAFIQQRNKAADEKFANIAADYMRVGEELNIRWDIAFFQMLLETGNLAFTGDVSKEQNNFAGLGATGRKNPGETFPDVATGVKAHLQHLLMYAGEKIEDPVAERTRKVQEWGVLDKWHKSAGSNVTYSQLVKQWAPGSRGYAKDIETISDSFYSGLCRSDDPHPEMMALVHTDTKSASAKSSKGNQAAAAEPAKDENGTPKVSGAELARRAVAEARASGSFVKSSLGAGSLLETPEEAAASAPTVTEERKPAPFKLLNAEAKSPAETEAPSAAAEAESEAAAVGNRTRSPSSAKDKVQTAALGSGTKSAVLPAKAADKAKTEDKPVTGKCRVWTASYGGAQAIIIKAPADGMTNYTVLDVNEATSKREAEAYIAAYAKGGQTVGEYPNQTQALDKAFELCPEG